MKYIVTIFFLSTVLLYSQTDRKDLFEQAKERGLKITEEGNDIYQVEYPFGVTRYLYLGKSEYHPTDTVPTSVIYPSGIDTNLYKDKYYFWQEVPVWTAQETELVIGDMNNNGYPEVYGATRDYGVEPFFKPVSVYELDSTKQFTFRFQFPEDSMLFARGIYDIKNNDQKDLLITSTTGNAIFYTKTAADTFAFLTDFIYSRFTPNNPGQIDNPKLGDFDKNGITDMLFYEDYERGTHICEYNYDSNNFEIVNQILQPNGFYGGYSIGDFDMDNKTDIVYGGIYGDVFVIEAEGEHNYSIVWSTNLGSGNAYYHTSTKDIDKNGKPEFWVGSTSIYGGNDVLHLTCFESSGDNQFEETYRIDFYGIYTLFGGNILSSDVDNDGTDELVFCMGDYVFIMKFTGTSANPSYQIYYMTANHIPGSFNGVTLYDLDNDGYPEMLIYRYTIRNDGKIRWSTYIYKPNLLVPTNTGIERSVSGYKLEQNYPNPFNPSTTIDYSIKSNGFVTLKVYDMLGKEVASLVNEKKEPGSYSVTFNASNVPSGIYVYRLTTNEFTSTKKLMLVK